MQKSKLKLKNSKFDENLELFPLNTQKSLKCDTLRRSEQWTTDFMDLNAWSVIPALAQQKSVVPRGILRVILDLYYY